MRVAIAKADKDAVKTALSAAVSAVDKGFQKGVLHKSTASRYKSRLNARQRRSGWGTGRSMCRYRLVRTGWFAKAEGMKTENTLHRPCGRTILRTRIVPW